MNDTTLPIQKTTTTTTTKPKARQKTKLRKGFALHDWKRLLLSTNDLAQRKGQPLRRIPMSEIKQHNTVHDGWIALHGKVYNIGPYLHYHPGGVEIFNSCLGGDASVLFDKYHRWVNIQSLIGPLLLGYLSSGSSAANEHNNDNDVNSNRNNDDNEKIIPSALTKAADGSINVSQLSMPPPRPVDLGKRQQEMISSSLLGKINENTGEDDGDDEFNDLNPWEKDDEMM